MILLILLDIHNYEILNIHIFKFKERFNHNSVIPHIVGTDTTKEAFWNEAIHLFI